MLILKKEFWEQMVQHCKEEFPLEACGIMAGKEREVKQVFKIENVEKAAFSFFMNSREQFKVMKEIENLNLEIIGIYHSHTGDSASPSKKDVELAFYPGITYIIVSLKNFAHPDIRAYRIEEGMVRDEELKLIEGSE